MASVASTLVSPPPTPTTTLLRRSATRAVGLKVLVPKVNQISNIAGRAHKRTRICAVAQPETLEIVQSTIAKQLSIEESTVGPDSKFMDLGADSLDTVEIMMALEEKFGVSIGEGGAESIATVQEAADLIEKVKAAA